jgi:hypothetical protein
MFEHGARLLSDSHVHVSSAVNGRELASDGLVGGIKISIGLRGRDPNRLLCQIDIRRLFESQPELGRFHWVLSNKRGEQTQRRFEV